MNEQKGETQQPLNYAVPTRRAHHRRFIAPAILVGFVLAVVIVNFLIVRLGQDRTPGNGNDMFVLVVLSPGVNLLMGGLFVLSTLLEHRRLGAWTLPYVAVGITAPLISAVVVYQAVYHHG